MKSAKNIVEVIINGQTVKGDMSTIAALLNMAAEASEAEAKPKPKQAPKPKQEPKPKRYTSKLDAPKPPKPENVLPEAVRKQVKQLEAKAEKLGYTLKHYKDGAWVWFYDATPAHIESGAAVIYGKSDYTRNRTSDFRGLDLQGRVKSYHIGYSSKRGQFVVKDFEL